MARRRGGIGGGAGRPKRTRRRRAPTSFGARTVAGGSRPAGGSLVALTPARRRRAARRILARADTRTAHQGRPLDFHLATCVAAARAGGRIVLDSWGRRASFPVREKGRNDFVTAVDHQAEEAIIRLIRARFPDHAILAEESAPVEGRAGFRWYVDPLDGTTNFIHGYPLFCVSVGLADPQGMRAAAVYDPLRDEMFTAARGAGAQLNGRPIRVSSAERLQAALLVTGIPFRSLDRIDPYLASFRAFVLGSSAIRRDGSAALNLAYVACGRYDGFWEMALSPWDIAAGSLIVTEAGGAVSDFRGRVDYLASGDIIAANRSVHPSMIRIVREAYRDA